MTSNIPIPQFEGRIIPDLAALGNFMDTSITNARNVVASTPVGESIRFDRLLVLALAILRRAQLGNNPNDFPEFIMLITEALGILPPGDHRQGTTRQSLLSTLSAKYAHTKSSADLDEAIKWGIEAATTLPTDPLRSGWLGQLSIQLLSRYEQYGPGDIADLDQAIMYAEGAVASHPKDPARLCNLAYMLSVRFKRTCKAEDIDDAIARATEAVEEANQDDRQRARWMDTLARMLASKFGNGVGIDIDILDTAIGWEQKALQLIHSERAGHFNNLSLMLLTRYQLKREGYDDDLREAIAMATSAREYMDSRTPARHIDRATYLDTLGIVLSYRYQETRLETDLDQAIMRTKEALDAVPPFGHRGIEARIRMNLSNRLGVKFIHTGVMSDLNTAINQSEAALLANSAEHPDRSIMIRSLANRLQVRYERARGFGDLQRAIELGKQAIDIVPDGRMKPHHLNEQSKRLGLMYQKCGDPELLDEAINLAKEALESIPFDHPHRAAFLINLSGRLVTRYLKKHWLDENRDPTGFDDLNKAIEHAIEAATKTDLRKLNGLDLPTIYTNLSIPFFLKYRDAGEMSNIDCAVEWARKAVDVASTNHPSRWVYWNNLGSHLKSRSQDFKEPTNSVEAIRYLEQAFDTSGSPPSFRIKVARKLVELLIAGEMWEKLSEVTSAAVHLLPLVSPRSLYQEDQQDALKAVTGIASLAAAAALQPGINKTALYALGLLELGRGIITGLRFENRADVANVMKECPDLAKQFEQLRDELDMSHGMLPIATEILDPTLPSLFDRRQTANQELLDVIFEIRAVPGFEKFLLPPDSADELTAIAAEGPIVIVNTTEFRSDAIIVTASVIKSLPLLKMIFAEVKDRMKELARLVRGKQSTYLSRNEEMEKSLLWLWDVAVEPILNELGFGPSRGSQLPRIWWIGAGPLAMAPFHAAGEHSRRSTRNTISRVISSYTPTIKALSYARQKDFELLSNPLSRLLIVTMPTTPDTPNQRWKPLTNVTLEANEIIDAIRANSTTETTQMNYPSVGQVLEKLPDYNAIHFACHGLSDSNNPSNSHLLLLGDDSRSVVAQVGRLTVGMISNMNLKTAQIAYLSACCTAENASTALADESIHIASGFQLAGYGHVLGTLWESNDDACRNVAGEFYRTLYQFKRGNQGHRAVSTAFHRAVRMLRKSTLGQPIIWASFIHTGA